MRLGTLLLATLAVTAAMARTPAAAETYFPWCARYGGDAGGASNCGFFTYEQCMLTVSGIGGFCERNLFYDEQVERNRTKQRKKQHTR